MKREFPPVTACLVSIVICLCQTFPAAAKDQKSPRGSKPQFSLGLRLGGNLGQGSGKGYWDWTEPDQQGGLYPLPGWGGGVSLNWEQPSGLILEASLLYAHCCAGQKVDSERFTYSQDIVELPLLIKARPLLSEKIQVGAGPSIMYLPWEGSRDSSVTKKREESMSALRVLMGIQAGMDVRLYKKAGSSLYCNFRFSHPFIAPEYDWEREGSGRFRINHVDLSLEYRGGLKK